MSPPSRTAAIVQARMSSRRFPGKMLARLAGKPLIEVVCDRLARARLVDVVVVATSDDPSDDPLAAAASHAGYAVYRGSLQDVLARFVGAARSVDADTVVRITGDCPCLEPSLVDRLIEGRQAAGVDYAANVNPPTWPNGLDCEVMSRAALEKAEREATTPHDREHVTTYIRARPGVFRQENLPNPRGDQSQLRWSVDHPEDLALLRRLWAATGVECPSLKDFLAALETHPELEVASRPSRRRNEGSIESLRADLEGAGPLPCTAQSEAWWARATTTLALGARTLAEETGHGVGRSGPQLLVRGQGCRVWDVDGNKYIDYSLGLASVPLGHAHPEVTAAVRETLEQGGCFSLGHPLQVQLAERLCALVPGAERASFHGSGSQAMAACLRAARAKGGSQVIARLDNGGRRDPSSEGTHLHQSQALASEASSHEIVVSASDLEDRDLEDRDLEALDQVLRDNPCAAVVLEPLSTTPPTPGYLQAVRDLTSRHGAALVFDERITGWRHARGGAAEYFGVVPDSTVLSSGIANGQPLSVILGQQDLMAFLDDPNGSLGCDLSAITAAIITLEVMEREEYWSHVRQQGQKLQDGYRAITEEFGLEGVTECRGLPPWTEVTFTDTPRCPGSQMKSLFQQEMLRRGILFSGRQAVGLAHDDDVIGHTIDAFRQAIRILRAALDLEAVDYLLTAGR